MQELLQTKVLSSLALVLRPIVKILLRYGIGYNQFAEVVKTVFVDVGSSDFGIRGRPTNISRVAVMSGLTRKEVRRLRTKIESGGEIASGKTTPITEILRRWHSEEDFLDHRGRPKTLPFAGDGISFTTLVRKFGGDVPPGAMRTELKRVGSISEGANGDLTVEKRSFWPADQTGKLQSAMVHQVYPLLNNVAHNSDPDNDGKTRAHYSVYSLKIKPENRATLQRMCSDRLADIAESFDDLFLLHESEDVQHQSANAMPVVVGMYYFHEDDTRITYDW